MVSHSIQQKWHSRLCPSQIKLVIDLATLVGCKAVWTWLAGDIPRWYIYLKMVTHPWTSRALCRMCSCRHINFCSCAEWQYHYTSLPTYDVNIVDDSLMECTLWVDRWTRQSACGVLRLAPVFTHWLDTSRWRAAWNCVTTFSSPAMPTPLSKCGISTLASVCRRCRVCVFVLLLAPLGRGNVHAFWLFTSAARAMGHWRQLRFLTWLYISAYVHAHAEAFFNRLAINF